MNAKLPGHDVIYGETAGKSPIRFYCNYSHALHMPSNILLACCSATAREDGGWNIERESKKKDFLLTLSFCFRMNYCYYFESLVLTEE